MKSLTKERLMQVVLYNPESGVFTRKLKTSNRVNVGDICGYDDGNGYLQMNIDSKQYRLHQLAWLYMTGEWPEIIDHINHDRADNRFINLRSVDAINNSKNISKQKNSISGTIGVTWDKAKQKWYASIGVNKKTINLGKYTNKQDAIKARKDAEKKHGFHKNHGKAA